MLIYCTCHHGTNKVQIVKKTKIWYVFFSLFFFNSLPVPVVGEDTYEKSPFDSCAAVRAHTGR